ISVVLFLLAFPCSAFFRLDTALLNSSSDQRPEWGFAIALVYVLMNFLVFGAYFGWRRGSLYGLPKAKIIKKK
ncbi:MAG TPA: hypothetical protein PLP17_12080, partial [Oligoflexia bacterium]|nr:hypothetical protein [Oligoflexia bacterium]